MLLTEPVHSEVMPWKALLEHADVLQKILQPSSFHAGIGVHHIFRYAGTQQPFLLGRGGCGERIQVIFEDPCKFGIGHRRILKVPVMLNQLYKHYSRQILMVGRWQRGQKD